MSKKIDKAALLAALQPKAQPFEVEGLGTVGVKQLTVGEVEALRASIKTDEADQAAAKSYDFGLGLLVSCVVDEDGAPMFDAGDLPALVASNQAMVDQMVEKALLVNGFKKAEAAKN